MTERKRRFGTEPYIKLVDDVRNETLEEAATLADDYPVTPQDSASAVVSLE